MKRKIIIVGLTAAMLLCGCGSQMPDMTDEQAHRIGEFAAITLLKYDANARSRLVDISGIHIAEEPETLPEEPEPVPEEKPEEPEQAEDQTPVIEIGEEITGAQSLESYLELPDGISIQFLNAEIRQDYSAEENEYFALEASPGKSLLVLNFQIMNLSGADQMIDLLSRRDVYRITVNQDYTRAALTTMLTNDLSTYRETLADGEGDVVVLLIEVEEGQVDNLDSIVLNLKNDSNACTIQLI